MFSIVAGGSRRILKYDAAGFSRFEPEAVRTFRTNWSYGVFAATSPRIHLRNATAPSVPRNLRLTWSRSAHLFVQYSTYVGLPIRRSTSASRLARVSRVSARKARTSSAVGGRPVRSRVTRRRNSASVQRPEGLIFSRCHFSATSSSTRL